VRKRAQPLLCVISVTRDCPPQCRNCLFVENFQALACPFWDFAKGAGCQRQVQCRYRGGRKAGMTSNQRGPLIPWATHVVQWTVQWVAKSRDGANPIKAVLSSDWRLQLASMKLESLVIADQNAAVNTFSDFVLTMKAPSRLFF